MAERSIAYEVVRYEAKRSKNWPPYRDLTELLLTNGCPPSIAFERHSCSLEYKAAPQEAFNKPWQPAIDAWAEGANVVRYIGYDASPRDGQRNPTRSAHYPLNGCARSF